MSYWTHHRESHYNFQSPVPKTDTFLINYLDSSYWDGVARRVSLHHYLDKSLAHQRRMMHLGLINEWAPDLTQKAVLKTDMFEEGLGDDHFFGDVARESGKAVGIDISREVTRKVRQRSKKQHWNGLMAVSADVRWLPFASGSFDVVISNSTLDHFASVHGLVVSLQEIWRVLKPDGKLILTLDNKANPFYYMLRVLSQLQMTPYFLGPTVSRSRLEKTLRGVGFQVEEVRWLSHHPRIFTLLYIKLFRRFFPAKADRHLDGLLAFFDRLKETRVRFITGAFIAVKATKISGDRLASSGAWRPLSA